jgi:hypothetical protein
MKFKKTIFLIITFISLLCAEFSTESDSTESTQTMPDSVERAVSALQQSDKSKMPLVRKSVDHRQQMILGVGMMLFITIMLTSAQSWNPRN